MNVDFGWQSVKVLYLFWITCSPLNLNSHTLSFLCLTRLTKPNLSFVSYSSQQRSIAQCFTHYIKERVFQIQLMFPLKIQFHSHFPLAVCLTTALTQLWFKKHRELWHSVILRPYGVSCLYKSSEWMFRLNALSSCLLLSHILFSTQPYSFLSPLP